MEVVEIVKNMKDKKGKEVDPDKTTGWGTIVKVSHNQNGGVDEIKRFASPSDALFATNYIKFLENDFGLEVDKRQKKKQEESNLKPLQENETKEALEISRLQLWHSFILRDIQGSRKALASTKLYKKWKNTMIFHFTNAKLLTMAKGDVS